MRSVAVSTLTSAGCAQAPGTGLAVRKPWTIEAATTFTKRANSPSRTANRDFSGGASCSSTRGSPSFVSAGSYLAPRSMVTRLIDVVPNDAHRHRRRPLAPLEIHEIGRFTGERVSRGSQRDDGA